jgi:perosamine synthetase
MREFLPISEPSITDLEICYVTDAVTSGWVSSLGPYIDRFESDFAAYCGTSYAVSTMNGTVALHLALVASGIEAGDEVIIPDLTFVATANAVRYIGAIPICCDVDPVTLCLDATRLEGCISSKTKAIIPVHLYGHPADMVAIMAVANAHDLLVIEDAAEAHGALWHGKKVGAWGECGVFSFYGNKVITSGEGGMVTTNNRELYERMRFLRDHAMSKEQRYFHSEVGFNYRITNLQAALGVAQMERIDEILARKNAVFRRYQQGLARYSAIRLNETLPEAVNSYWMICLEAPFVSDKQRDEFMCKLKACGVDSRPYFRPVSSLPMYSGAHHTPVSYRVSSQGVNLPSYFSLEDAEIDFICGQVQRCFRELSLDI